MIRGKKEECWKVMKYKQMRINEVGRLYQDGFPDDEVIRQVICSVHEASKP